MPGRVSVSIAAFLGFLWGGTLGVITGGWARDSPLGSALAGAPGEATDAGMFWLEVFLLLSLVLFLPPFTRKAGWLMLVVAVAHVLGVAAGYAVGYR